MYVRGVPFVWDRRRVLGMTEARVVLRHGRFVVWCGGLGWVVWGGNAPQQRTRWEG